MYLPRTTTYLPRLQPYYAWRHGGRRYRLQNHLMKLFNRFAFATTLILALAASGCKKNPTPGAGSNRVVLYCSVDDVYARPIIRELEKQTGLKIQAKFDTEATKTLGLASSIRSEKDRPVADVFWSSALLQTLLLDKEGLLQRYKSPAAKDIPTAFKEISGAWTGLGVRSRDIIYHKSLKSSPPRTLLDLLQPRFKGKVGISNPQFGTGSDWAAALAVRWGVPKTLDFFRALKENGVKVLPGNSVVADRVARGELLAGVTDTDDFLAKTTDIKGAQPMYRNIAGRATAAIDGVLVPGTVAMIAGAPNPENARKLIDALVSAQTEKLFAQEMPGVLPLRGKLPPGQNEVAATEDTRFSAPDDTASWAKTWKEIREPLAKLLLSD